MSNEKGNNGTRIPIHFVDRDQPLSHDDYDDEGENSVAVSSDEASPDDADEVEVIDVPEETGFQVQPNLETEDEAQTGTELDAEASSDADSDSESSAASRLAAEAEAGGPVRAELIATRAELRRVQTERDELRDAVARRQADFENYRKRVERERSESYNRMVGDVVSKLLPVFDNLRRALDSEGSFQASESEEFRHFLHGVELIYKQLSGVLEGLGLQPIPAVGHRFDPHVHEAVVTEQTDEYEPDTVIQEIVPGYRLGEKLLRPAIVKVAIR